MEDPRTADAASRNQVQQLAEQFVRRFGEQPLIVWAPGRVNLIGEHTDYNDGFVLPAAIDFGTSVAIAARADHRLLAYSSHYSEQLELDLLHLPASSRGHWTDYVIGVARKFMEDGHTLGGASLLIDGNVPLGAGLSSSASLEVALMNAFSAVSGATLDGVRLARLCQQAENEFVGARCGIMDQFVSVFGRKNHALLLDCRSLEVRALPLPEHIRLVVCNTMVRHSVAAGEYNQRRADCEAAARFFAERVPGVRALRDVTLADLESKGRDLPEAIRRRVRHVIAENLRVLQAAAALERKDLASLAILMADSHASLRDDFQVSCAELDLMVELAQQVDGVFGARMTGGGFGGCTINLVRSDRVAEFEQRVRAEYQRSTGHSPEIYVCSPADGASRVL